MIEHHLQVRQLHIARVAAPGSLFAVRGPLALSGRATAGNHASVRYLSGGIDTLLLAAAVTLAVVAVARTRNPLGFLPIG